MRDRPILASATYLAVLSSLGQASFGASLFGLILGAGLTIFNISNRFDGTAKVLATVSLYLTMLPMLLEPVVPDLLLRLILILPAGLIYLDRGLRRFPLP